MTAETTNRLRADAAGSGIPVTGRAQDIRTSGLTLVPDHTLERVDAHLWQGSTCIGGLRRMRTSGGTCWAVVGHERVYRTLAGAAYVLAAKHHEDAARP